MRIKISWAEKRKAVITVRIEKLELNKVKVIVYPVDLNDMNINIKTLRPDSPQLHTFLFEVMERVKKETGFNPYSGQIVVEALPMEDCVELTVTKISEKKPRDAMKSKPKRVRAVLKNKEDTNTLYTFESFDNLCKALMCLNESVLNSASYYRIENNHLLNLKNVTLETHTVLREFMSDFDNSKLNENFLREHGELIAENDRLITMAKGISDLYS